MEISVFPAGRADRYHKSDVTLLQIILILILTVLDSLLSISGSHALLLGNLSSLMLIKLSLAPITAHIVGGPGEKALA